MSDTWYNTPWFCLRPGDRVRRRVPELMLPAWEGTVQRIEPAPGPLYGKVFVLTDDGHEYWSWACTVDDWWNRNYQSEEPNLDITPPGVLQALAEFDAFERSLAKIRAVASVDLSELQDQLEDQ